MWRICKVIVIWNIVRIQATDPELPPCPTNMHFFPQNLPMHCRMTSGSPVRISQQALGKQPDPIQIPMLGFPGPMPGNIQGVPGRIAGLMPGMPSGLTPGAMPIPLPMPMMPMPAPASKIPVIVMPFYSQDTSAKQPQAQPRPKKHKKHRKSHIKKRPKSYYSEADLTDVDTSSDEFADSSSDAGWWESSRKGRRSNHHKSKKRKHKQELLTPVLQYVTKDGYVIYEKQISKGEAKDWLGNKNTIAKGDTTTTKHAYEIESHEPKDEVDGRFVVKEEHEEVSAKNQPQMIQRKKNAKRKTPKKHV